MTDVRTALADAANTVAGVNVSPYYRQSSRSGDGLIQMNRIEFPNKFGGVTYWDVIVTLPTGPADAQRTAEELVPDLVSALAAEMTVTGVTFSVLAADSGPDRPCLVVSGWRESE